MKVHMKTDKKYLSACLIVFLPKVIYSVFIENIAVVMNFVSYSKLRVNDIRTHTQSPVRSYRNGSNMIPCHLRWTHRLHTKEFMSWHMLCFVDFLVGIVEIPSYASYTCVNLIRISINIVCLLPTAYYLCRMYSNYIQAVWLGWHAQSRRSAQTKHVLLFSYPFFGSSSVFPHSVHYLFYMQYIETEILNRCTLQSKSEPSIDTDHEYQFQPT